MKIMEITEKISHLGQSAPNMPQHICVGEAHHIWHSLACRYDALNITYILMGFAKDNELKIILEKGIEALYYQIEILESLMKEFSIPMPAKPPEKINIAQKIDCITDETIFRHIFHGLSDTLMMHINNYRQAPSSHVRESFKKLLLKEMDLFDKFLEYGKLKGYLHPSPTFRP